MTAQRSQSDFQVLDPNDQRCSLRKITPRDGLTLRQAMLFYGGEKDATEFLRLDRAVRRDIHNGFDRHDLKFSIRGSHYLRMYERLQRSLLSRLATGDLHATGYGANSGIDERAQAIPSERWRTLKADIDTSQATSPGLEISGVLVFERPEMSGATQKKPAASQARVRAWYRTRVREAVDAGLQHTREEDEAAARLQFGFSPRSLLRDLRRELAPQAWQRSGRPMSRE